MSIDSTIEAIEAVQQRFPAPSLDDLWAHRPERFPDLYYVTEVEDGPNTIIGGWAYIVERDSGQVERVPSARPPSMNCSQVQFS